MGKRILYIVNVDWFFISHRLPIALEAMKLGAEVHVACAITDKAEELKSCGIKVHNLSLSRSSIGFMSELNGIKELFKIIRRTKPDIVHAVTIKPAIYGSFIARLLRVPVRVASISGLGYTYIAPGFKSRILLNLIFLMYRVALKGAKAIIFQNNDDRYVFRRKAFIDPRQEIIIRGSGVDLDKYSVVKEPNGTPVVMLIARLLVDKGVVEFVEAARELKKSECDIRMVLVGSIDSDNPKSITDEQLKLWVESGVVEHWGFSSDVATTISKSNIIVLPSYREGLPKSLIEAAACGRAVITTDVPGCRDAIDPNKTGVLVPVKDSTSLAEKILKLVNEPELRHQFGRKGREFAMEVFDIKDVVNQHMNIYFGDLV